MIAKVLLDSVVIQQRIVDVEQEYGFMSLQFRPLQSVRRDSPQRRLSKSNSHDDKLRHRGQ
jgi:hypothetical protein